MATRVRPTMKKEVTFTTVQVARMTMENGEPKAEKLPEEILVGNYSLERAQKELNNKTNGKYKDNPVTVFGVQADTKTYKMDVAEFIKVAEVVEDQPTEETAE